MKHNSKKVILVLSGCLISILGLCFLVYWNPSIPNDFMTEYTRSRLSEELHEFGLADIPRKVRDRGRVEGGVGESRIIISNTYKIQRWLSESPSIKSVQVIAGSDKKAYVFIKPSSNKICIIIVAKNSKKSIVYIYTTDKEYLETKMQQENYSNRIKQSTIYKFLGYNWFWNCKSSLLLEN